MARRHGAAEDEIATLGDLGRSPLPDAEKQAIRFAEKMTVAHRSVSPSDVEGLRAHWRPGQIVELLCVVGLFNYLNRFAEALALEPTRPGEGGPPSGEGESRGE